MPPMILGDNCQDFHHIHRLVYLRMLLIILNSVYAVQIMDMTIYFDYFKRS